MENDRKKALVIRPSGALEVARPRHSPVITRMTQDVLLQARETALRQARFRIGDYELREPDYRQILRWAKDLDMDPVVVLSELEKSYEADEFRPAGIEFVVEDGAIVSLPWDFNKLPIIPDWERGLCIEKLDFAGTWPEPDTSLRPRLPKLNALFCSVIGLHSIDLSGVPGLTKLVCFDNQLTELDLSPVPGLTGLSCRSNQLTELDLSPVPGLTWLGCYSNQLTELDLSPVPGLAKLWCRSNQLTELDLSPVPRLTYLACRSNQLTELDLSPVPELTELYCQRNQLTELDLSPVPGLTRLDCSGNKLTELDLSPVPGLTELYCWINQLTELDLSPVPGLELGNLRCDSTVHVYGRSGAGNNNDIPF